MSNEIKFSCLSCGQRIVCDAAESGRPMLCPACNGNLTVPHLMSDSPERPAPSPEELPVETPASVPAARRTSGLAVASLVCSLSSLILWVGWIPGIICGHLARHKIRHNPTLKGKGMATAGLIISYATVLIAAIIVGFALSWWMAKFKETYEQARLMMVTNTPIYTRNPSPADTNESAEPSSAGAEQGPSAGGAIWTLNVKDAKIPDNPVSGKIHGVDFQYKRALFRNGNLKFIPADGQDSLTIRGLGKAIENNRIEVETASGSDAPKIEIAWNDGGENRIETFQDGYAMELNFGGARGRRLRGQIYLCLPDDSESYIAGTFTVILPKPMPKPSPPG